MQLHLFRYTVLTLVYTGEGAGRTVRADERDEFVCATSIDAAEELVTVGLREHQSLRRTSTGRVCRCVASGAMVDASWCNLEEPLVFVSDTRTVLGTTLASLIGGE
jgi:hypothetical protein